MKKRKKKKKEKLPLTGKTSVPQKGVKHFHSCLTQFRVLYQNTIGWGETTKINSHSSRDQKVQNQGSGKLNVKTDLDPLMAISLCPYMKETVRQFFKVFFIKALTSSVRAALLT